MVSLGMSLTASLHASLLHKPFSALTGDMRVPLLLDLCPGSRKVGLMYMRIVPFCFLPHVLTELLYVRRWICRVSWSGGMFSSMLSRW